jgi:septal ring factor EnvC (AmiA/AmiB activator)
MEGGLRAAREEIGALDGQRAALLAQLAQLEARLARAHAARADAEESRAVFEEGVAFSLDALQQQARPSRPPACACCDTCAASS